MSPLRLSRAERKIERLLDALYDHDVELGDPAIRSRLLDSAADAVWRLFVQREAGDLTDHQPLLQRFDIPQDAGTGWVYGLEASTRR